MLYLGAATGQVAAQPRQNESWRATWPVAAISPRLGDIAASPMIPASAAASCATTPQVKG